MRKISSLIIIAYSAGIVYPAGACFMSCFGGRATCGCCIPQQIGPEPEIKAIQEKIEEHDAKLAEINNKINQRKDEPKYEYVELMSNQGFVKVNTLFIDKTTNKFMTTLTSAFEKELKKKGLWSEYLEQGRKFI